MRGIFAGCALTLLLAVAWADHHHHHGSDHVQSPAEQMTCHKLSEPNADFAFSLYKSLKTKHTAVENIFYSPLGISTALSMLSTGARANTHSQMFSTLGYSALNQAQVDEAYKHLFHMLSRSQQEQVLNVGNSLALRSSFQTLEKFLNDIQNFYSGKIFEVDFTKPEEAATQINTDISTNTNGMIKDMVKDLDPEMAMVLINYVYFRGQWEKPFDSDNTEKMDFHVNEQTTVQVDMMKRSGRYDYYQDTENHTSVVMLPYKGDTSMMIVLPDEGKMAEVEDAICKEHIKHWHDSLFKNSVDLFLPKFSISAEASLDTVLQEMGMTDAFGDSADFSGISEETNLKVSKISHKAVLSVDETGTEAAAATTVEVMPMSMPEQMKLDRPFLVFIVENSTRSILFMGKINNPTAV